MKITGILEFYSLFDPIRIGGEDILPKINTFFEKVNGKKVAMINGMQTIEFKKDETSDRVIEYKRGDDTLLILLNNADGSFGMSNIGSYLPDALQRLNGQKVIMNLTKNLISFEPSPENDLYEIYYTRNNSCKIPDDDVKTICRPGSEDTCIFLSVSGEGFECQKFDSSTCRTVLYRLKNGTMNAKRIGSCKLAGRRDA